MSANQDNSSITQGGPAPTYVNNQPSVTDASSKPKGKNLTEGGFESDDSKNASFNNEIGTENDPGRVAENKFVGSNEETQREVGKGAKGSQFGVLESEEGEGRE